ncbi:TPA: bifunctional DNA primase/polymerase [Clostridioides difficile]|nr:bifunctional DNA primase/polymerase [Clostridioides difficile]
MELIINEAQRYIDMGLPIIPCKYNGKAPLKKAWASWAQTNSQDISDWQKDYAKFNIGLVTGLNSGILAVDIDGQQAYDDFYNKYGKYTTKTCMYKTSEYGWRILFKIPGGKVLKSKSDRYEGEHQEISFLANGKQTIMPPSIHPEGHRYEWIEGHSIFDVGIQECPKAILDLLEDKVKKANKKFSKDKGDVNIPITVINSKNNDTYNRYILNKFLNKCDKLKDAIRTQKNEGLSEDEWFNWISIFSSAGLHELAKIFSGLSNKHDERSDSRIDKLKSEGAYPIRCTTLGCDCCDITSCYGNVNYNKDKEITNSPVTYLSKISKVMTPKDPVYSDTLKKFENIEDYTIDKKGRVVAYPKGDKPLRIVSNYVIVPEKQIIRDNGEEEEGEVLVHGLLEGGKKLSQVCTSINNLMNLDFVPLKWGIMPYISPGTLSRESIRVITQQLSRNIETEVTYTHLGWTTDDEGRLIYLHSGGAVGKSNVNVDINENLSKYKLPSSIKNKDKALFATLDFLDICDKSITVPLLAMTYLSPLVSIIEKIERTPNFIIWMHGLTGSRKTSLALAVLNHFGDFTSNTPPATFKDTHNSIEVKMFMAKDSLIVIDDFHPGVDSVQARQMKSTAEKILRNYGDRIGRSRMNSNMGLNKTFKPRGLAIVTGEDLPNGTSSTARFVGIEVKRDFVDLDKLTKIQENHELLSEAMFLYIQWISNNKDRIKQLILLYLYEARDIFNTNTSHARIGEGISWLYVGFNIFKTFLQEEITENCDKITRLDNICSSSLDIVMKNQIKLYKKQEIETVFLEALEELINTNKLYLVDLNENNDEAIYQGKFIGYKDKDFLYLHDATVYGEINTFLNKRNESLNISMDALLKIFRDKGMIKTETNQLKPKKLVPVDGERKRLRLVHLKRASLNI